MKFLSLIMAQIFIIKFSFHEVFINLIWKIISNNWFFVIINGDPIGFFPSNRGLRQGDPLSPSLFIIASEVLSRGLNHLHATIPSVGYSSVSGCPIVSHLSFVDDVIIFCNGNRRSLLRHKSLLADYEKSSGQMVNVAKSSFFVAPILPVNRSRHIAAHLGYSVSGLPITYFGYPLYYGRKTKQLFDSLVVKLKNKVKTWLGGFLNPAGCIALIKRVLHSITAYQLASIYPPKSVVQLIEKFLGNIFWGQVDGKLKSHWVSWRSCCRPTAECGLGVRALSEIIQAHSIKLWW